MAWEKIDSSQVKIKSRRGAVQETAEYIQVIRMLERRELKPGSGLRLRTLPDMPGVNHPASAFAQALRKEIMRLGLPYRAGTYDNREVYVTCE